MQKWEHLTVARQHEVITARLEKQARQIKWREENPDKIISAPAMDIPPPEQ
ncbi:MAG: hypothetical protein NXH95_08525 [Pseudomonadaceae bacterium]|nr:hypothetical protein [Pseudomonadaceae bacterium]